MKLATREDVAAPIDTVFKAISDFEGYERAALRRGVEVARTDSLGAAGVGMTWHTRFPSRGREREANITLTDFDAPNALALEAVSSGLQLLLNVDLVALSRTRTRLHVTVEAKAHSIPARLLVQSVKLARSNMLKRFRRRVARFAEDIEESYQPRLS